METEPGGPPVAAEPGVWSLTEKLDKLDAHVPDTLRLLAGSAAFLVLLTMGFLSLLAGDVGAGWMEVAMTLVTWFVGGSAAFMAVITVSLLSIGIREVRERRRLRSELDRLLGAAEDGGDL